MPLQASDLAEAQSFRSTDQIVGTYYFYWYDAASKTHVIDDDGSDALTTHPATLEGLSWRSVAWHRRQLEDMMAAGIDVVLPVFWGAPSEQSLRASLHWSYEGIPPLVQAREALVRAGRNPPRIGLFYDTSTLQYNAWHEHQDLTTERGRQWFYATVRDFFSLVPPRHWAMIDDRPIVLLYSAAFAKAHDQSLVTHLQSEFARDFGGRRVWLAREVSWRLDADSVVAWGGALGLKNPGGIASLGPGYDHSAVPGRSPLIVDRRGGAFYEEQWLKFLRRPTRFVMIETWNEWHEGTDIAESKEYGRQFIDLTRKYVDRFRQGWRPPWPTGPFQNALSVSITLGATNSESGLKPIDNEDGRTAAVTRAGRAARAIQPAPGLGRYVYFAVDDSFKGGGDAGAGRATFRLQVEYFDATPGRLSVEYDGSDERAPFGGAYSRAPETVTLMETKAWRTAGFTLRDAKLVNSQNRGADFRLVVEAPELAVGRVTLTRGGTP